MFRPGVKYVYREAEKTSHMTHEVTIGTLADVTEISDKNDPAVLLAALCATDSSILPVSVGTLPLPFSQPDVEFVFQAHQVCSSPLG